MQHMKLADGTRIMVDPGRPYLEISIQQPDGEWGFVYPQDRDEAIGIANAILAAVKEQDEAARQGVTR